MALDTLDLPGTVNVVRFNITFGNPSLSADYNTLTIPFIGYAVPTNADVDIIAYEYSMDNGTTWETMTLDEGESDLTGLTFDVSGESYSIAWLAKTDVGLEIYNTPIRIRIKASATFDDDAIDSPYTARQMVIERTVLISDTSSTSSLPTDYKGISGGSLLKNAPKTY